MPVSRFHELLWGCKAAKKGFVTSGAFGMLERMALTPKFVFSEDVMNFVDDHQGDFSDALTTAIEADLMELPHNPMLVEYMMPEKTGAIDSRVFWLIEGSRGSFRMWPAGIWGKIGPYALDGYFPLGLKTALQRRRQPPPKNGKWHSMDVWQHTGQFSVGEYVGDVPFSFPHKRWDLLVQMAKAGTFEALFYAMALHVRGVETRPAPARNPKLDKARAKRGQPALTHDYVTVHIGYVTDREGNRHDYVEGMGNHVRVHLRRGHVRNQPCGPGMQDRKVIFIKSVIVNYRPDFVISDQQYLVVP